MWRNAGPSDNSNMVPGASFGGPTALCSTGPISTSMQQQTTLTSSTHSTMSYNTRQESQQNLTPQQVEIKQLLVWFKIKTISTQNSQCNELRRLESDLTLEFYEKEMKELATLFFAFNTPITNKSKPVK